MGSPVAGVQRARYPYQPIPAPVREGERPNSRVQSQNPIYRPKFPYSHPAQIPSPLGRRHRHL